MRVNVITSPTNQKIKDLVRLKDRKSDRADSEFVVEGLREIRRAQQSGFELVEIYLCPELLKEQMIDIDISHVEYQNEISREVFQKIAVRDGSDGIVAVFKTKLATLESLSKSLHDKIPLLVAVEDVEKPGNLGAILRTADAAGVHAVIVLDHAVDPWNQNVIRASLGGVFSIPVIVTTSNEFYEWTKANSISIVAAALESRSKSIYNQDLKMAEPVAIILGSEARGLSSFWLNHATHVAKIPMSGICDSLNVSVAAAIFIYEAVRQR